MRSKRLGWKKALSLLLCAAMLFSLCAQTVLAEGETEGTEGSNQTETTTYFEGNGTEGAPYEISTLEDLEALRDAVNGGINYTGVYFRLTADIAMSGADGESWAPIGSYNSHFTGIFDGNNCTISGLYINSDGLFLGLFGFSAGTIKDLTVEGQVTATGNNAYIGGIAGANTGTMEGCSSSVTVSADNGNSTAGGIVGDNSGTVKSTRNAGAVSAEWRAGGIAGVHSGDTVEGCSNTGMVSASGDIGTAGGIVGVNGSTVESCYNTGNVSVNGTEGFAGGVIGTNSGGGPGGGNALVRSCYNIGVVSAEGTRSIAGGILGWNRGNSDQVENCYYLSDPDATLEGIGADNISSGDSDSSDTITEKTIGKTAAAFASGEVAYLLNGGVTTGEQAWYQTLDSEGTPDPAPVLESTHGTVYQLHYTLFYPKSEEPDETTLYANAEAVAINLPTEGETADDLLFWYTDEEPTGAAVTTATATPVGNAYYAVQGYRVTLDTKGGTINSSEITGYPAGIGAALPTDVEKTGYKFAGWYELGEDSQLSEEAFEKIGTDATGTKTFVAVWHSTNAGVTAVSVSGYPATPDADNGTIWSVELPFGTSLPAEADAIKITLAHEAAAITDGPATEDEGATWPFTVTAEDGETTATYTIRVFIASDPAAENRADVDAAKAVIEAQAWTVPQETANTPETVQAWVEEQLAALNESGELHGVAYTVAPVDDAFTAAIAGDEAAPEGISGAFAFTVTLSKGEDTGYIATSTYAKAEATISGTITPTAYTPVEPEPTPDPTPGPEPDLDPDPEAPEYQEEYKLERNGLDKQVLEQFQDVPDIKTVADIEQKLNEKLDEELTRILAETVQPGEAQPQTKLFDVRLQVKRNGKWEDVHADDFPKEGIVIWLCDLVPDVDQATHSFAVTHMLAADHGDKKAGTVETMELVQGERGLYFVVHSLSPIGVAWVEKAAEPEPEVPAQAVSDGHTEALIGVAVVAAGGAALLAYHYREALPIWKLAGMVTLADETGTAGAGTAAAPVADAVVTLYQNGELVKTLTTDANGVFAARLPKGSYEAIVTWERDGVVYTARKQLTAENLLTGKDAALQQIVLTGEADQ